MNKFNIGDRVWFLYYYIGDMPEVKRGIINAIKKEGNDIMYRFEYEIGGRDVKECYLFLNDTELKTACEKLMHNKLALLEKEKDWVKESAFSMVADIAKILESENKKED